MIVYCPACYQPARLPSGDGGPLSCPNCSAEVDYQAIEYSAPTLLATTAPTPVSDEMSASPFGYKLGHNEYDGDEPSLIEANFDDEYELAPHDVQSVESDDSQNILNEVQIASANVRRRKPKSAVGGLLGVVLGGLLAFPIATAIVWYGFGRDPFQVAPYVVKYAPLIVPEKFGGGSMAQRSNRQYSPAPPISNSKLSSNESNGTTTSELPSVVIPTESDDPSTSVIENSSADQAAVSTDAVPDKMEAANQSSSELPFKSDAPPTDTLESELQAALSGLENSFDQMLQTKDDASITNFLDSWQVYSEMLYQMYSYTGTPKLAPLEKKLAELTDKALLGKLIEKSKARLSNANADTSIAYVDVFELTNVENGPSDNLVQLVPTDRNREPIKSMKVLASSERFSLESESGQNQRFMFLGFVTKSRDSGQDTFYVLMSRPL